MPDAVSPGGDLGDGAVADRLVERASLLGYDEIHRAADPAAALDGEDHVVVCVADAARGRALLARVLAVGDPGYLGLVATEKHALVALLKLSSDRIAKDRLDRIRAPAGVPVGAETAD